MSTIQADVEARLADVEPEVEVLLAEVVSADTVRLFIDHPRGVTLDLCERVTHQLDDLRSSYALEVSSPGPRRPLGKPRHFKQFVGSVVRVRARHGDEDDGAQRSLTGELLAATDAAATIAAPEGVVTVAYEDIVRANLVPGE